MNMDFDLRKVTLGNFLLKNNVLEKSQLIEAMSEQKRSPYTPLEEILVEKSFATEEDVYNALNQELEDRFYL